MGETLSMVNELKEHFHVWAQLNGLSRNPANHKDHHKDTQSQVNSTLGS